MKGTWYKLTTLSRPGRPALLILAVLALSAAAGLTALTPASAASDPNAAAPTITYTACSNGLKAISTTPAPGFNPLTATDAQLNANNYPIRPQQSDRTGYAQWKKFVLRPNVLHSACPTLKPTKETAGVTSDVGSSIWAGYIAHQAPFAEAEAEWNVPQVVPKPGGNQYSASWVGVGLGQSATYPLMQAGTDSDYVSGSADYYAWFEVYPEMPESETLASYLGGSYPVSPGDLVGAHVRYVSTGPTFHVWDDTKGWNAQFTWSTVWSTSDLSDGHAEWIYERPQFSGKATLLADAAPHFTAAQAEEGGTWEPMGNASLQQVTMSDCNSHVLADAGNGLINSEAFNTNWDDTGAEDASIC